MTAPRTVARPVWLEDSAFAGAVLVLTVVLAYVVGVVGGQFHFDDFHNFVENPHVRSLANVPRFFADATTWSAEPGNVMYRPVHMTSYAIDHAVWGYRAPGWVLTNCLLHAGVVLLVWRLALRLGLSPLASFLAAAVMALHPAHSEVVNYVSSRSESLAAALMLGALHLHLTARTAWPERRGKAVAAAIGALALVTLSLGAKETTVLFFLAVAWLELVLGSGGAARRGGRAAAFGAVYALSAVALLVARKTMTGHATAAVPLAATPAGADPQAGGAISVLDNVLWTQSRVVVLYLQTLLRPVLLNVDHDVVRKAVPSAAACVALAVHAAGVVAALAAWRRGMRLVPLCAGWFWLFLAPSVAYPLNVVMNEHRLYLPGIAVALLAGAALARVAELLAARHGAARGTVLAAAPLVLLAALCVDRSLDWRSDEALWSTAVRRSPGSARAHMHLGAAWHSQQARLGPGEGLDLLDRAIAEYHVSERLFPRSYDAQLNLGMAYLERGRATRDAADLDASLAAFRRAGGIVGERAYRPRFWQAQVLAEMKRWDEAVAIVEDLRRGDDSGTTLYDDAEGRMRRKMGDRARAEECILRVIARKEPEGDADALLLLGWWRFEDGDVDGARGLVDRAIAVTNRNVKEGREPSFLPYLYAARMMVLLGLGGPEADSMVATARKLGWSAPDDEVRWVLGGATPGAMRGTRGLQPYGLPR